MFDTAFPTQFLVKSLSGKMEPSIQYISDHDVYTTFAPTFGVIASAAMCVLVLLATVSSKIHKDEPKIPPGPRGWPIVGMS